MKIETCPLYHCCVIEKKLEHCGLCNESPCNDFLTMESNDPNLSSKDAEESAQKRKNELIKRKTIGKDEWLKEKETST